MCDVTNFDQSWRDFTERDKPGHAYSVCVQYNYKNEKNFI